MVKEKTIKVCFYFHVRFGNFLKFRTSVPATFKKFPWFLHVKNYKFIPVLIHTFPTKETIKKLLKRGRGDMDDDDSDDDTFFGTTFDAVLKAIRKACPTDTSGPIVYKLLTKLNDTTLTSAIRVHTNWAAIQNAKMGPLSRSVFLGNRWSGMWLLVSAIQLMRKGVFKKKLNLEEAELRLALADGTGDPITKMIVYSEKWSGK